MRIRGARLMSRNMKMRKRNLAHQLNRFCAYRVDTWTKRPDEELVNGMDMMPELLKWIIKQAK